MGAARNPYLLMGRFRLLSDFIRGVGFEARHVRSGSVSFV